MPGLYSAPTKKKKASAYSQVHGSPAPMLDPFIQQLGGWGTMALANQQNPVLPPNYTRENIGNSLASIYGTMTGGQGSGLGVAATPGSGGGTAGVPPAPGGLPTDPWTGFAGNYAAGGAELLWDKPEILIRDRMKQMGFNPNEGMMDLMEQYAPLMQYMQMLGLGTGDPNSMTPETLINFTGDWVKDMMTPGKGGGDVWKMIGSVLDAPDGSALAAALESGTPEQQAITLNNLIKAATAGMPPVFQQALGDLLEDKTTDWLSQKAKGTGGYKGFLSDWLQKGGKGILG